MSFLRFAGRRATARARRLVAPLAAGALALALLHAAPAAAQTRFAWPDTAVDVSKYETAEECTAAIARVGQIAKQRSRHPVWLDTMPWSPAEARALVPVPVTETARRCSARFAATAAPLEDAGLLVPLYLSAGRDADAITLSRRRFEAFRGRDGARGDSARARADSLLARFVFDSLLQPFIEARPVRLAVVDSVTEQLRASVAHPLTVASAQVLLSLYAQLLNGHRNAADSAAMRAASVRFLGVLDSLPAGARAKLEEQLGADFMVGATISAVIAQTRREERMDSLRKSSGTYFSYLLALWTRAGGTADNIPFPIGQRALPLTGTVIGADGTVPRPVRGKVNAVVFLEDYCVDVNEAMLSRMGYDLDQCAGKLAVLRRLAERFPALEITLVDRTAGFFQYLLTPDTTAEIGLRRQALVAHRASWPAVISVGRYVRVTAPDRRLHPADAQPNFAEYSFRRLMSPQRGETLLVDQDGLIVASGLGREWEEDWAEMIGILLARKETR